MCWVHAKTEHPDERGKHFKITLNYYSRKERCSYLQCDVSMWHEGCHVVIFQSLAQP